jgi:hypothetical protein
VDQRVVWQGPPHAQPVALSRLAVRARQIADPHLDGGVEAFDGGVPHGLRAHFLPVAQPVGAGRLGHRVLVGDAVLGRREARRQVEDGLAGLVGLDAPGREAAAVADAVDDEADRHAVAARSQEVAVQRVEVAFLGDRSAGRDHGLGCHDPAKEPPAAVPGIAEEQVGVQRLQIELLDEPRERRGLVALHRRHDPGFARICYRWARPTRRGCGPMGVAG